MKRDNARSRREQSERWSLNTHKLTEGLGSAWTHRRVCDGRTRSCTELRGAESSGFAPHHAAARQRRGLARGRRHRLESARDLVPGAVAPPAVVARLAANVAAVGVAVGEDARRIIRCLGEPSLGSALERMRGLGAALVQPRLNSRLNSRRHLVSIPAGRAAPPPPPKSRPEARAHASTSARARGSLAPLPHRRTAPSPPLAACEQREAPPPTPRLGLC